MRIERLSNRAFTLEISTDDIQQGEGLNYAGHIPVDVTIRQIESFPDTSIEKMVIGFHDTYNTARITQRNTQNLTPEQKSDLAQQYLNNIFQSEAVSTSSDTNEQPISQLPNKKNHRLLRLSHHNRINHNNLYDGIITKLQRTKLYSNYEDIAIAANLDKQLVYNYLVDMTNYPHQNHTHTFALFCLTMPEFIFEKPISMENNSLLYKGLSIAEDLGITDTQRVVDVVDRVVGIQDSSGEIKQFVQLHLGSMNNKSMWIPEFISVEKFNLLYGDGHHTNPEIIADIANCTSLADLFEISQQLDTSSGCLPIFVRQKIFALTGNYLRTVHFESYFLQHPKDMTALLKAMEPADQNEFLGMYINILHNQQELISQNITSMFDIINLIDTFKEYSDESCTTLAEMIQDVFKKQINELTNTFRHKSGTHINFPFITNSFKALEKLIEKSYTFAHQEKLDIDSIFKNAESFTGKAIQYTLDFRAKHPNCPTIFQTHFDLMTLGIQALQEDKEYAGKVEEHKHLFYDTYSEHNRMNQDSATTDTQTDIARVTDILECLHELGHIDNNSTLLLAGSGNCQRLEEKVLRNVQDVIKFSKIKAIDLVDYSAEIPQDLGIEFEQTSLTAMELHDDEQYDVVLLPWSVLSDVVEKEKTLLLFDTFSNIVKKGGHIILDIPFPMGKHSYEEILAEQLQTERVLGIMRRSFQLSEGQEIESIFSFPPLEETIVMAGSKGFVPMYNIPASPYERALEYKKIQENDSQLTLNHIPTLHTDGTVIQKDHKARRHAFWQATSGGQKFNRVTLILRKEDYAPDQTPSILSNWAIPLLAEHHKN